jgi:ribosomal protein L11 methylase PrmA
MLLSKLLDIRLDLIRLTIPGGTLICSGLIRKQEEELRNSLTEMGFVYRASLERKNWNSIQFQRFGKES